MLDNKTVAIEDPLSLPNDEAEPIDAPVVGEKSIKSQISGLVDDVRKLAEAELEYYRVKLSVNMAATKTVLILFSVAAIVGIVGAVALILGLLLILSHYWGPVAATGLLTGSTLLVTTFLMNMAIKRARKLPLDENDQ